MEVTYAQVASFFSGMRTFIQQPLPPRVALRIARAAKLVEDANKLLDEQRMKLIAKHGTPGDNGKPMIDPKNTAAMEAFGKDYADLLQEKTTLETKLVVIPLQEIGGVNIAPGIILELEGLVEFKE